MLRNIYAPQLSLSLISEYLFLIDICGVSRDCVAAAIFLNPTNHEEEKEKGERVKKKSESDSNVKKSRVNLQCGIKSL